MRVVGHKVRLERSGGRGSPDIAGRGRGKNQTTVVRGRRSQIGPATGTPRRCGVREKTLAGRNIGSEDGFREENKKSDEKPEGAHARPGRGLRVMASAREPR